MAFVLAGLGAIGLAVGTNYISETFDELISKPVHDKWDKEVKDSDERLAEELRQKQHNRTKETYKNNDEIRSH